MKLKYLCSSFSNTLAQASVHETGKYRVYGAGGLIGYLDEYGVSDPYLGIVKDGAGVGRVQNYEGCTSLLGTMAYIVPNEKANINWLKYAIQGLDLGKDVGITTIPHIYFSDYGNREIKYVDLAKQERIASFLDAECSNIDFVIDKTKDSIEEYKKLKQAIITQAVTKGIRSNRCLRESGIEWIGTIPSDWSISLIRNVAYTSSGGTPDSSNPLLYDGEINWICSYDLKEQAILESERKISKAGADVIAGSMQPKGSVLVAMYGGAGTIGNSGILECEAMTNQAICSIKFNNKYINDYFGFFYIMSIRRYWMIYAIGTRKDPNISQEIVRKMPIVIPPLTEQRAIVDYLKETLPRLENLLIEKRRLLSNLEQYKRSLIYEYTTGKKEVV